MEIIPARLVIDYQNIHLTGHDQFAPPGTPKHDSLVSPLLFAEQWLIARNNNLSSIYQQGKAPARQYELEEVHVFRGSPSNSKDPDAYRRSQAQRAEWTRDSRVKVTYRTLTYRPNFVEEKGIDVLVAIDLIRSADRGDAKVIALASHDTDLEPALSAADENRGIKIETVGWEGCRILRIPGKQIWHTRLNGGNFIKARDRRVYP